MSSTMLTLRPPAGLAHTRIVVSLALAVAWGFAASPAGIAAAADVDSARARALAWLTTNQRGDGSWSSASTTDGVATAAAVEAFGRARARGYSFTMGAAWLANARHSSTDALARAIIALEGSGVDPTALVRELIAWRNAKGAWGAYDRFETTFPDTALALGAIRTSRAAYPDGDLHTAMCAILNGWVLDPLTLVWAWAYATRPYLVLESPSLQARSRRFAIVPTALNALELDQTARSRGWTTVPCFNNTVRRVVDEGVDWLVRKRKSDNGFGAGPVSTVVETALVYRTLSAIRPASTARGPALEYLIAAQATDGSWGGDAFETATVLAALDPPLADLADTDSDGVADAVEAVLATNRDVPDSRFLASGNGLYTLTSLSPASALAGGPPFTLTVTGWSFTPSSVVRWNGVAQETTVLGATRLQATIPPGALANGGSVPVSVFTPAPAGGSTAPMAFTVLNPAPVPAALTPSSMMVRSAAFTLTVAGTGFVPSSIVRWNGLDRSTTFVDPTRLLVAIPAGDVAAAGTASVAVSNPPPAGGTSAPLAFSVNNPAPGMLFTSPKSATAGGAAFTLTVTGTSFVSSSVVQWNGAPRTTTFLGSQQLRAAIPASDIATASTVSVTVVTPGPGGGTTSPFTFSVKNPIPALTSMSPRSATAGTPGFTLVVTGYNFVSSSVVRWNGADRLTTFVSSNQLRAEIAAGDIAIGRTATVSVVNPGPGGGTTTALTFSVTNPAPAIGSVTPASITAGGTGFALELTGSRFVTSSVVRWNGTDRPTTFIDPTHLRADIPAADIATGGIRTVSVFTPTPGGGTASTWFTVSNPPPSLTTLSPAGAVAGAAPLSLTVSGSNFVPASIVLWNGSSRSTTFLSPLEVRAAIGASDLALAGTATVSVLNPSPGGGATSGRSFTVSANPGNPVPMVTALSPPGAVEGGAPFTLTLTGGQFVAASVVRWNGQVRPTTVVSATQLQAAIPASDIAARGTTQVSVTNPAPAGGTSAPLDFSVAANAGNPVPGLGALAPSSAYGGTAFTVTASGTSFVAGTILRWKGVDRPTTVLGATTLQTTITATDTAVAGPASVTLFSPVPGGGTSNPLTFTVNPNPTPSILSLAPPSATAGTPGFTLVVDGSNFMPASVVRWNGADRPTSYVSSSRLQATIAAADVSVGTTASINVFTPAPGGGTTSTFSFTVSNPSPTLAAMTPSNALPGTPGLTLTVGGSGFVPASVVLWNGAGRPTTFVSGGELRASIPASDLAGTGVAWVSVVSPSPGGGLTAARSFAIPGAPSATALAPASASAGSGDVPLHVSGTRFIASSQIVWNGRALFTTPVDPATLRATIPAADLATTGTRTVQVWTPGSGGGVSGTLTFTVLPVGDIVIDNGQPGTSFTGAWAAASPANPFGPDALVSPGLSGSTYRWTPTIPIAGTYEVFLWWPADAAASAAAPVAVVDDAGPHALSVNQQTGSGWQSLGTFAFRAGAAGYVEISDASGVAIADAARFAPRPSGASVPLTVTKQGLGTGTVHTLPAGVDCGADCTEAFVAGTTVTLTATPAPGSSFAGWSGDADCANGTVSMTVSTSCIATFTSDDIVVDDGQPGASFTGAWSSTSAVTAYGGEALVSAGGTGAVHRWTPAIPATWQYQVHLWWPVDATLSASVPVTVVHSEPSTSVPVSTSLLVDQRTAGGQWRLLGTFTLPAGTTAYVEISDANGRAAADAVRLVPFAPPYEPDPCGGWCGGDPGSP